MKFEDKPSEVQKAARAGEKKKLQAMGAAGGRATAYKKDLEKAVEDALTERRKIEDAEARIAANEHRLSIDGEVVDPDIFLDEPPAKGL